MSEISGDSSAAADADIDRDDTFEKPPLAVIAGFVLAILAGLVVVGVAGALEADGDCGSYGYGGYGCVDYDDAQLVADPATDLVDYQLVTVSGVDFDPPWAPFAASQCLAQDLDTVGRDACDESTTTIRNVDGNGNIVFSMRLRRFIETAAFGTVDCAATDACVIGGATVEGSFDDFIVREGTTAPLHFDPDAPPVDFTDGQVFVDPATDLVDRQTVTVTGVDIDPHGANFGAAQCDATLVLEHQADACDLRTSRIATVGEDGTASLELTVRRIITTAAGGEVDCAVEGACDIGGGSFEGFATAIEGDRVPILFDENVPPVPPLELDVTVDEITASTASGTVTCNREATFQIEGNVTQTKGRTTASAYGYFYDGMACDTDPSEWTMMLNPNNRRFTGGSASYMFYAYAYDGFESAFTQVEGDTRLRGRPHPPATPTSIDGTDTSIAILGASGSGDEQVLEVLVECGRAVEYASVNVSVRQFAGLDLVRAYGYAMVPFCDGAHVVEVPLTPNDGVLVGGPAQASASVYVHDHQPPEYFHDNASATDTVRLSGQLAGETFDPVPNPDSRITIDEVTRSSITGTVECEEPVMVDLSGYAVQQKGRSTAQASGYSFFECDGTTPFTLETHSYQNELGGGPAAVQVYGNGYVIIPMPDYDRYEYRWGDNQQASVRVRGR